VRFWTLLSRLFFLSRLIGTGCAASLGRLCDGLGL
jgi:hypothetical protein